MNTYEPSDALKACTLWTGSLLEVHYRYKMFSHKLLVEKRNQLLQCDDLTTDEKQLLAVLLAESF